MLESKLLRFFTPKPKLSPPLNLGAACGPGSHSNLLPLTRSNAAKGELRSQSLRSRAQLYSIPSAMPESVGLVQRLFSFVIFLRIQLPIFSIKQNDLWLTSDEQSN
jgi:hypothetical protein